MKIATPDVSQAFVQAPRVAVEDQLSIRVPWYVIMHWEGKLRTVNPNGGNGGGYYFLTHRPLYGLKDSPLRWYLHLCQTLRPGPYMQCRTDVCLLSRHENDEPCAWMIAYFDDILIAYAQDKYLGEFVSIMKQYRTGAVEKLTVSDDIMFSGMDLTDRADDVLTFPQANFVSRLQFPNLDDIVRNETFAAANGKSRVISVLPWVAYFGYFKPDMAFRSESLELLSG